MSRLATASTGRTPNFIPPHPHGGYYPDGGPALGPETPKGLHAIYSSCHQIYPDQPNPLQVTAVVKFWLDGPDPLDYISMYANRGDRSLNVPPHWHYVSFGLSDLHGDGRVHENMGPDGPSGFGFELTFRLKREVGESAPPTWPAALLQALARYVFTSGNMLCSGDHIPWHTPLDGSESRVQHMLITEDPQLQPISTHHGSLTFLQVVGVCEEELKAAQHWNGPGVIDFIKSIPLAGGPWLFTDMRRGETIFDIDPELQERVNDGIEKDGSNLSGVSGHCTWEEVSPSSRQSRDVRSGVRDDDKENSSGSGAATAASVAAGSRAQTTATGGSGSRRTSTEVDRRQISNFDSELIKETLKKGLHSTVPSVLHGPASVLPPIKQELVSEDERLQTTSRHATVAGGDEGLDSYGVGASESMPLRMKSCDAVHIKLNLESGALLPLALRGRLKHGHHFTFKSAMSDFAVTLLSSSVSGSIATRDSPYAAHGAWLQVLLSDDFIEEMLSDVSDLGDLDVLTVDRVYQWDKQRLTITILADQLI